MLKHRLIPIVQSIVKDAEKLRLKHAAKFDARVSYCAIFCQSDQEFDELNQKASDFGRLGKDTKTGPVYVTPQIQTKAGPLRIVKIRKPDPTRPERGDADFAVSEYQKFKQFVLGREGFKLIERDEFEMIELMDPKFKVRAYFSNPPVEQHSGIKEALEL